MTAASLRTRWKLATSAAITEAGGLDVAAAAARVSLSQMHRYKTGSAPDLLTISGALALAEASGCRAFADLFADLAGLRCTAQREADEAAPGERRALAAGLSEAGELIHQIAEAMADGVITPTERGRILKSVADMQDVLADIQRAAAEQG